MLSVRDKQHWSMLIVLLVAALLRFMALPTLPLGLHYDEAANFTLAQQIAAGDYWPVFIRAYTGKEVLFFYFAAPWVRITGMPWGLRLGAAMLGVLTVAATYAAVRALLRTESGWKVTQGERISPHGQTVRGLRVHGHWVALFSSAWVAVSFPHLVLSRYGFRAISQPLLQALVVATLWRGLSLRSRRSAIRPRALKLSRWIACIRRKFQLCNGVWLLAAGGFLGLAAYTYLAVRLFPIPLALALGVLLLHTPRTSWAERLWQFAVVLAVALLVFSPLGIYFLKHPDAFATRIKQVASPTWQDAVHGVRCCLRALAWPNAGDPYVRFNKPGRPLLDPLSAVLALIGGVGLLVQPLRDPLNRAGRFFLFVLSFVMLLPSALATSEITPSNLRLVGLYPFLAVFPAHGLMTLMQGLLRLRIVNLGRRTLSESAVQAWYRGALVMLLVGGGMLTGWTYRRWARSAALFYAADGEMVLAAQALDTLDLTDATPYIASLHYRHPTVAALARNYSQAKWLTGGATFVLPIKGGGVYLLPRTLSPPAPWPGDVVERWETLATFSDPNGQPALIARRLTVESLDTLRQLAADREATADFSHVLLAHDARALRSCAVGHPCPVLLTWEARAPYPALQPVVRLVHPLTGEWARTTAFHYPPEQWTMGDLVLDQFSLIPPVSAPPVDGYEIAVGFFNPDDGSVLSRLDERSRFAGLEVRYALGKLQPQRSLPASPRCSRGSSRWDEPPTVDGIRLLGVDVSLGDFPPGGKLSLTLCWQAGENFREDAGSLSESGLEVILDSVDDITERGGTGSLDTILYKGAPVQGLYPFVQWSDGEIVEDRYTLHIPRDQPPGVYRLRLRVASELLYDFGALEVFSLTREFMDTFVLPEAANVVTADFGRHIRLLGYAWGTVRPGYPLTIRLYWQTLREMDEDYTVFIHLLDFETGQLVSQVDEWPQDAQASQESSYPTSLWMQDEVVQDRHNLSIPEDLPSGIYQLRVGFYVQQTGARLRVKGAEGFVLSTIEIEEK
jgi:hypothetical protein